MPVAFNEMDAVRIAHAIGGSGPRRIGFLFAPSHCGKSSLIRAYILHRVVPEMIAEAPSLAEMDPHEIAHRQRRVLHVTIGENATVNPWRRISSIHWKTRIPSPAPGSPCGVACTSS